MKIISSFLAMSLLMSNVGLANTQTAFDPATDEAALSFDDDDASTLTWEEGEERIAPVAIIGIIIGAIGLGCQFAKNEGEALARRDPGARKTYNNNRWYIRVSVLAGSGAAAPATLAILRCFENGLNS